MQEKIQINCPVCQQVCWYESENKFRPFCSKRCQNLDFGAWSSEQFKLPVTQSVDDEFNSSKH